MNKFKADSFFMNKNSVALSPATADKTKEIVSGTKNLPTLTPLFPTSVRLASHAATRSSTSHSRFVTPEAIAGVTRSAR
jgi:hypothetical protein